MHRRGSGTVRRAVASTVFVTVGLVLAGVLIAAPARAAEPVGQPNGAGEGEGAYSFAESWGCGVPATLKPFASKKGTLSAREAIRGPFGDFLGRDIGDIWSSLVEWEVPLSGGKVVKVHERALPGFDQVTANIAAAVADGLVYQVKSAGTYNPRTIGGSYRFSFHAFGTAIDMNASRNPYRGDNVLITDMPDAFVQAWRDAGFCWGGDWEDIKDPMHFAWMGPEATPGYGEVPPMYPVPTDSSPFVQKVFERSTPLGPPRDGSVMALADGNGDAAADVFRLSHHPLGLMIEYSRSSGGYAWCTVSTRLALGTYLGDREAFFGDYLGSGRMDVWLADTTSGSLSVDIVTRASDFSAIISAAPGHATSDADRFLAGDFDGDSRADLYVLRSGADETTVDVYGAPGFDTLLYSAALPIGGTSAAAWSFSLGDYDLDGGLDLFALSHDDGPTAHVMSHSSGYQSSVTIESVGAPATIVDMTVRDFDGDGRVDLQYLNGSGRHSAYLGNTETFASATGWFWAPNFACEGTPYTGLFNDDDGNDHESDIDIIALAGVTYGCNPPDNTHYCSDGLVTRGQMAAFFNRMLGLDMSPADWFTDDDASEFEDEINRIARAGLTYGCNPPDNTWFCPAGNVTRGQMAAFISRALGLTDEPTNDFFVDDDLSVFETDINRLTSVGVAFGYTLDDIVSYCPDANMPRDHMATFLARALDYLYGGVA